MRGAMPFTKWQLKQNTKNSFHFAISVFHFLNNKYDSFRYICVYNRKIFFFSNIQSLTHHYFHITDKIYFSSYLTWNTFSATNKKKHFMYGKSEMYMNYSSVKIRNEKSHQNLSNSVFIEKSFIA